MWWRKENYGEVELNENEGERDYRESCKIERKMEEVVVGKLKREDVKNLLIVRRREYVVRMIESLLNS